jgi:hypothetical protein
LTVIHFFSTTVRSVYHYIRTPVRTRFACNVLHTHRVLIYRYTHTFSAAALLAASGKLYQVFPVCVPACLRASLRVTGESRFFRACVSAVLASLPTARSWTSHRSGFPSSTSRIWRQDKQPARSKSPFFYVVHRNKYSNIVVSDFVTQIFSQRPRLNYCTVNGTCMAHSQRRRPW